MSNNKFSFTTLGSKLDKIALKSKNLISDGQELLSKYENIFDDDDESTQNAGKRRIRKTRKTKSRTRKPRKSIKSKKSRRRNRSRKNRKSRKSRSRSRKVTKRYARNVAARRRARILKKM